MHYPNNKLQKTILCVILLHSTIYAFNFFGKTISVKEGMPVPWAEIKEAILKPSNNAFDSSSFVIENFTIQPLPGGMAANAKIPAPYQALAMLMGFQSAPHLAGRWFNFLNGTKIMLDEYKPSEKAQIIAKLSEYRKTAREYLNALCPGIDAVGDIQLMACWLYSLSSASPAEAMQKCQEKLFLEKRPCIPLQSRADEARLILMHDLPLFLQDGKGGGCFCLGFFEKDGRTAFVMLDCSEITRELVFSFLDENASARPVAKIMEWQKEWRILYVPRITRAYSLKDRMLGIIHEED